MNLNFVTSPVSAPNAQIIFSKSAKNHNVTIESIFVRFDSSKEQAVNWKVHLEAEKGIELNPNDIVLKEEDHFKYRINCTGAVIL